MMALGRVKYRNKTATQSSSAFNTVSSAAGVDYAYDTKKVGVGRGARWPAVTNGDVSGLPSA